MVEQPREVQPPNVQDVFLQHLERSDGEVTVFLANGIRLHGTITRHDRYALIMTRGDHAQLVYKHAISTVMPGTSPEASRGERREAR